MGAGVTLVKRWISDLSGDGSPLVLFGSRKPSLASLRLMKRSQTKVSVLHVASSPSAPDRPHRAKVSAGRAGRELGKDAKATTTKDPTSAVCLFDAYS